MNTGAPALILPLCVGMALACAPGEESTPQSLLIGTWRGDRKSVV